MSLRKIQPRGTVGVAVDKHKLTTTIARVSRDLAMLPHRKAESAAHPVSVGVDFARPVQQLVTHIKVREVSRPSAVMPMIAHQAEVRRRPTVLRFEFVDHLTDQLIGLRDGPASRTELAAAFLVA